MSLKLGTQDISGISQNTKYNAHHLLDFKWTDCIMNDVSWLRADTFSWQSGDVYTSAYNHLVADLQGTTAETETIGSYTVTFYRATDGHKIVLSDMESTVLNIYNESGIAWYYIVDTVNTQFKLPRTKYGFEGLRNNVGDMIPQDVLLPNITGLFRTRLNTYAAYTNVADASGAFYVSGSGSYGAGSLSSTGGASIVNLDASRLSSVYSGDGTNTNIQQKATQMYLYFYVGDYTQTAIEQTAGLNAELFNGKADTNLANTTNKLSDGFLGKLMPDLSSGVAKSTNTDYVADMSGLLVMAMTLSQWQYGNIQVNSIQLAQAQSAASNTSFVISAYVQKGNTYRFGTGGAASSTCTFYPLKGAN